MTPFGVLSFTQHQQPLTVFRTSFLVLRFELPYGRYPPEKLGETS